MQPILHLARESEEYQDVINRLQKGEGEQALYGLTSSQKAYVVAALTQNFSNSWLVVVEDDKQATQWLNDLMSYKLDLRVVIFPAFALDTSYRVLTHSHDVDVMRMQCLHALLSQEKTIVIATIEALSHRMIAPTVIKAHSIELKRGDWLDQSQLLAKLAKAGYERVTQVSARAQFSVRGGIIDIYPLLGDSPYRIEFYGDEIDTIRSFSVETQLSKEEVASIELLPASEKLLNLQNAKGLQKLKREVTQLSKRNLTLPGWAEQIAQWQDDIEKMENGMSFTGAEQYFSYFYEAKSLLPDYASSELVVIWDEPSRLYEKSNLLFKEISEDNFLLPSQQALFCKYAEVVASVREKQRMLTISLLSRKTQGHLPQSLHSFAARQAPHFHGQMDYFKNEVERWQQHRYHIVIACTSEHVAQTLANHLLASSIQTLIVEDIPARLPERTVLITIASLDAGFEMPDMNLVILTEQEVLGIARPRKRKRSQRKEDEHRQITSYRDLNVGDYVVHVTHGIGIYQGIKTMEIEGVHQDYLAIRYKGTDRLYIPVDQIHLVQKYIGSEGKAPKLYSLGSSDWQKIKKRVKASVENMAKELIALYAQREAVPGIAYPPDDDWQLAFESSFTYDETPDQLEAIAAIKKDMMSPRPMDRLLCGDVGYGKTEVALRAAFKAATAGYQVAVLVPTTLLAHQHYNTFSTRCAEYPIIIRMLSRFRTQRENEKTKLAIKQGSVDIVIGTHALLQKSVVFKNLGLLIVDEEQRFGVRHKERIKQISSNIDVLTLSATPIPRTLHMAMVGIRDLSMIESPPPNRYPIQTYVVEYSPNMVRDAIMRELSRGGQVYYVHNRVKDIQNVAAKLQKLVPEAQIAIGHGKMNERELERLMMDFLAGEYDVLISTTIIETGLDIPNVNTIIIDEADKYGLAQLYQLRGRVGRTNRIAYAYLTYKREKVLSEVAEKRLNAIKEFTELGAGFKIALRDLQIRGAGNILGPEQSGFMTQVGYDLYVQMLDEAIKEQKGVKVEPEFNTELNLQIDAYIPSFYIADNKVKVEMYKKIQGSKDSDDCYQITDELIDRFGEMPSVVNNLLLVAHVRVWANKLRIKEIKRRGTTYRATFAAGTKLNPHIINKAWSKYGQYFKLTPGQETLLEIDTHTEVIKKQLKLVLEILTCLGEISNEE